MPVFKPQDQDFLKFYVTVQCHERWLLGIFYLKPLYFGQKELIELKFLKVWVVGSKFIKFLMSCLKLQISFSLQIVSLFSVMRLQKNWSVVSKITRIWWKLIQKFESLKNLRFHLLLLCKVFNVWPKEVQRSYLSWHWRVI